MANSPEQRMQAAASKLLKLIPGAHINLGPVRLLGVIPQAHALLLRNDPISGVKLYSAAKQAGYLCNFGRDGDRMIVIDDVQFTYYIVPQASNLALSVTDFKRD